MSAQMPPPSPPYRYHEVPAPTPSSTGPLPPPPVGPPQKRKRPRGAALAVVAIVAGLVGGGAGGGIVYGLTDGTQSTTVSGLPSSNNGHAPSGAVTEVAGKVLPSTVSILTRSASSGAEGTGIIVSSSGQILTNNHVIAAAQQGARVTVSFHNGKSARATVVGTDPTTDLAVIKAQGVSGLTPATLGNSKSLEVGDPVVAVGSPLGLSGTVTSGIVSALHRPVQTTGESSGGPQNGAANQERTSAVLDAIQTDAAINPGNSGGPLVDMDGKVVGINSAIATLGGSMGGQSGSIGLGFSIPISEAWPIAQQLIKDGTASHALLGVRVSSAQSGNGAAIVAVTAKPAAEAGLQAGDVVTKVDNRFIDGPEGLVAAVRSYRPGDTVKVTYERGGSTHTTEVTLGSDR
ncbi:MAG: S1C family serine protease [Streptosporangiales bacterium]